MTKEQLIQIAKVAFSERAKEIINFENAEIISMGNVYRLYDKDCPFNFLLPRECYFSIEIGANTDNKFVQIQVNRLAFNHYAAIKEMEKLGLI